MAAGRRPGARGAGGSTAGDGPVDPPIAPHLYLHVPFCDRKCGYCAFPSVAGRGDLHAVYVDALLAELDRLPPGARDTVYVGGGTPTVLGPDLWSRLAAGIAARAPLHHGGEWTVEANPTPAAVACFPVLRAAGVERVSLGLQTSSPPLLRILERRQDPAAAWEAVAAARAAFPRIGADLILGIPGQGDDDLARDLERLVGLEVDHLSVYALSLDPGGRLAARRASGHFRPLPDERVVELLRFAWRELAAAGYAQYETSSFARPGGRSRHNLAVWRGEDYHAAGAAAVSCVAGLRCRREPAPERYVRAVAAGADAVVERERLGPAERLNEAWMLGLRLVAGVERRRLAAVGDDPARWEPIAAELAADGLLDVDDERLALTPAGRLVQDAVTVRLLP